MAKNRVFARLIVTRFDAFIRPVFEAIHGANMGELGGTVREDGRGLKPPGWQPAGVASIIEAQHCVTSAGGLASTQTGVTGTPSCAC